MGRIAGFPGDSKRKRGDTAEKSGDLPEKLNRVRSLSLFGGGIQRKPRVIRGALDNAQSFDHARESGLEELVVQLDDDLLPPFRVGDSRG